MNTNNDPSSTNATTPTNSDAPVITTLTNTKVNIEAQYQTLVNGILANLKDVTTFEMGGGTYALADLISQFQQRIAAAEKTKASKTVWHTDVLSERQVAGATGPLRKVMQSFLVGRYGAQSPKLGEFGFSPGKPRKVSAQTKAAAAVKAKATRVARNTVGKKQRKEVPVPAAGTSPAPAPTTPPATSASPPASTAAPPATGAHPTTGGAS
jgi:hypothetical protein